jgi:hypothetical protein
VVHVTSSQMLHQSEVKDGRSDGVGCGVVQVERKYASLYIIFLLAP